MKLYSGIYFDQSGITKSIGGMHMQTQLLGIANTNINGFNKVGYQKTVPVVSSFSQFIGVHGLSNVKDESVGRITMTKNPLDFALSTQGYFQYETPAGIEATKDGRFKIDKDGNLLNLKDYKVLGTNGMPIKFSKSPESLDDIKVDTDGKIKFFDKSTKKTINVGTLSVVASDGSIAKEVNVKQGYVESSNVALHEQFFSLVPVRRTFEANRQLYIIQNDQLNKTIQQLGGG